MKVYRKDSKIVFEYPEFKPRQNPWTDGDVGEFPTFTGIIEPQKNTGYPNMGFALTIDMDYKGKGDQWSDIVVQWLGDEADFVKKCEELDIDVVKYDQCARCKNAIHGTSTSSLEINQKYGGPVCSITCED